MRNGEEFVGWQVLVGFELHGDAAALARLRGDGAQNASSASDRHALAERDLRWHGKDQFDGRAIGDYRLSIEKDSTTAQVLGERRDHAPIKMNRQGQKHVETLALRRSRRFEVVSVIRSRASAERSYAREKKSATHSSAN